MKLAGLRVDSFLNKPDPAVFFVLLFGPDNGLVAESAARLILSAGLNADDPFSSVLLTPEALKHEPARLADEALSLSLMGGRRLVRLRPAEDSAAGAVQNLLALTPAPAALVIAEAGELSPRSKLRQLAEESPHAAAMGCYPAEGRALEQIIEQDCRAAGVRITADAKIFLAGLLPADRLAQRGEIRKLITYAGAGGTIAPEDVLAVVADAGAGEMDKLFFALTGGDARGVDIALRRLQADDTASIALLRGAQRHFWRLLSVAAAMEGGQSAEGAVKSLRPPVFFKDQPRLIQQAGRWKRAAILRALARLADAEAACKHTGAPDGTLAAQALLGVMAR